MHVWTNFCSVRLSENEPCFVYFDSLDDLVEKLTRGVGVEEERRAKLKEWAERHTRTTKARWSMIDKALFTEQSVE